MRTYALLLTLALPVLPGCVLDIDFDDWSSSRDALAVDDAYVEGDLGEVQGVASAARVESATQGHGYLHIDLRARGRGWAVMHAIDLETESLEVGDVFDSEEPSTYVGVLGCSGPADGQWEFDRSADRVVVEVHEGSTPDKVRLQYRASYGTYEGEPQHATGSLEVERF